MRGQTEIQHNHAALRSHLYIGGLQVAMQNARMMQREHCVGELRQAGSQAVPITGGRIG